MTLVDTHCHLYADEFKTDSPEVIRRAMDTGVGKFYLPNIDMDSIPDMLALEKGYPGVCYPMMGLHPCYVKADFREHLRMMQEWLEKHQFAAIGEIGLDFHWDMSFAEQQREAFQVQIEWGIAYDLPIVIHSRKSMDDCILQVEQNLEPRLRGIFHCFNGSLEQARKIIDMGFYLGIGGVVTYKNGGLEPVISALGLDWVVLETDAPYLSPVPFRGKRNQPAYLLEIATKIASITGITIEDVAAQTSQNAEKIFGKQAK